MDELQLITRQQPGMVAVENVEELRERLSGILARYDTIVYSEDSLKAAQADKRELTKLRKQIEEQCNAVKTAYLAPYEAFEKQVKVLLDMVDGPLNAAKRFIQEMDKREKEAKKEVIRAYFLSRTSDLGEWAEALWNSSNFFDPRWLNKGTTMLMWRDSLDKKLKAAVAGLRRTPILEAPADPSPKPAGTTPSSAQVCSRWRRGHRARRRPLHCPLSRYQATSRVQSRAHSRYPVRSRPRYRHLSLPPWRKHHLNSILWGGHFRRQ